MDKIEQFDQEKTKVLKYIIYKKRTEQEIRKKFSKTIDENLLEDIIEYLKEAQYIDDNEYVEKTVHNFMVLKNLSIKEIQYKLIAKGIDRTKIENYIAKNQEKLEEYEIKSAQNLIDKKSIGMEQEEIKQYLIKKGYKIENINRAIEK